MFGSTSDDDIQTDIYIPLDVARTITGIGQRLPELYVGGRQRRGRDQSL